MLVDLGYCLAEDLVTHEDSETCQQAQKFNLGCHACGKLSVAYQPGTVTIHAARICMYVGLATLT